MYQETIQPDMLLTVKDVAELLCVTSRTVWRWALLGRIPRPVKLARRTVRWRASAIQTYIDGISPSEPDA